MISVEENPIRRKRIIAQGTIIQEKSDKFKEEAAKEINDKYRKGILWIKDKKKK